MGWLYEFRRWLSRPGSLLERALGPMWMHLRDLAQTPLESAPARLIPVGLRAVLRDADHRNRARRVRDLQAGLREILAQQVDHGSVIIFPPSLSWEGQLFQRPQQLARALAAQGSTVFYMELQLPPGTGPFKLEEPRLFRCAVPIETFWILDNPVIYTLTWMRPKYWLAFTSPRLVYDWVDSLDAFAGSQVELRRNHDRLLQRAELVLATAQTLFTAARIRRPDAVYCPNGVDYEHFSRARRPADGPPPVDLAPVLAQGRPIIGYHGALARWFDTGLLQAVAALRRDLSFVLVGPEIDLSFQQSPLWSAPNVYRLGARPYGQLPEYLRYFDAAMIPFKLDALTHATSPVKLFEYMAAGKPVVVTPMRESLKYAGVLSGASTEEFAARLSEALQLSSSPAYLRMLDEAARANTWIGRARQILDCLEMGK